MSYSLVATLLAQTPAVEVLPMNALQFGIWAFTSVSFLKLVDAAAFWIKNHKEKKNGGGGGSVHKHIRGVQEALAAHMMSNISASKDVCELIKAQTKSTDSLTRSVDRMAEASRDDAREMRQLLQRRRD